MQIPDLVSAVPLMLVRLSQQWRPLVEEVETGYYLTGGDWYAGIDSEALRDSMRAWWRFKPETVNERRIEHVVAVLAGRTVALYKLNGRIGPCADGRWAMWIEEITSGPLFDEIVGETGRLIYFRPGSANPIGYWPSQLPAASGRNSLSRHPQAGRDGPTCGMKLQDCGTSGVRLTTDTRRRSLARRLSTDAAITAARVHASHRNSAS